MRLDLFQLRLELCQLTLGLRAMRSQHSEKFLQLRRRIARAVIHIDDFFRFGQRKTQALRAQRELQARAILGAVHPQPPAGASALRREQSHVFVKTNRTCGQIEFASQIADCVGLCCHRDRFLSHASVTMQSSELTFT